VLHSVSHNINIIYDVVCRGQNGVYDSRRYSRSAIRHHLTVPRYRLSTFGHRAFSVAGPTVWNSLPDSLRDPALNRACSSLLTFRRETKSRLFRQSCSHVLNLYSVITIYSVYGDHHTTDLALSIQTVSRRLR